MQGPAIIIARAPGESALSPFGGEGAWCIATTGGITTVLCGAGGSCVPGMQLLGCPGAACGARPLRRWLMACCSHSRCSCSLTVVSLLPVPLYAPHASHAVWQAALRSVHVAHTHSSSCPTFRPSIPPLGGFDQGWVVCCRGRPPASAGGGGGGGCGRSGGDELYCEAADEGPGLPGWAKASTPVFLGPYAEEDWFWLAMRACAAASEAPGSGTAAPICRMSSGTKFCTGCCAGAGFPII